MVGEVTNRLSCPDGQLPVMDEVYDVEAKRRGVGCGSATAQKACRSTGPRYGRGGKSST